MSTIAGSPTLLDRVDVTILRDRAARLRRQAEELASPLADVVGTSFLRRAAELELAAWAIDAKAGVRYEDLAPAA
jgi:hypothetical protein